jgi:hypothetical protein
MRKGIAVAAVTLITVCFFLAFIKSSSIEKDSANGNQLIKRNTAIVNASDSTQTQFVYGSKKKLISDF